MKLRGKGFVMCATVGVVLAVIVSGVESRDGTETGAPGYIQTEMILAGEGNW